MSAVKIKPKDFSKEATQVEIEVRGFKLNSKTGTAIVIFKDSEDKELKRERVEIPEDVFSTWGTDDSVIQNYVFAQLGLEVGN